VSSHQLAEVAQTVDQVVIISQGARVFEGKLDQLRGDAQERVHVRCSDPTRLATALAEHGVTDIQSSPDDGLTIIGATSVTVGDVALAAGVAIYRMAQERTDLEQQFLQLTTAQYQPRGPYAQPGYLPAQPGAFGPPAQPPGAYGPPAQPPGAFGPPAQQPGAYGPPAQLPNQEGPR
jgi:ABC-2 type transport system ATP-binding protein